MYKALLSSPYLLFAAAVTISAARADESANIDTGHFAVETHGQEIADLMRDLLNRKVDDIPPAAN